MSRYFEYQDDKSAKFWEITLDNSTVITRYGKIGTDGQKSVKKFDSTEKARMEYDKLMREKIGKGYTEKAVTEIRIGPSGSAAELLKQLINEAVANSKGSSDNELPMFKNILLWEYPAFARLSLTDEKFVRDLTLAAVEKLKSVIAGGALWKKAKDASLELGNLNEWYPQWSVGSDNPNPYNYFASVVEDLLKQLLGYLIRWHFVFRSGDDFTALLSAYEFEYEYFDEELKNGYWHFPISLTLGKLNVFASQNSIPEKAKTYLAAYPQNRNSTVPPDEYTLEAAEVFFEARAENEVAPSPFAVYATQPPAVAPEVVRFLNTLTEQATLANPWHYSDYGKLSDYPVMVTLKKQKSEFKQQLADLLFDKIKFMYQNMNAHGRPFDNHYDFVKSSVYENLFTQLLRSYVDFQTEGDFTDFFDRLNFTYQAYSGTATGFVVFNSQAKLVLDKLTAWVTQHGMTDTIETYLTDYLSKRMRLIGVLDVAKKIKKKLPDYVKMVAQTGKIPVVLQTEPQKYIIDWCRIADDVPLINGKLYNIGFFPRDVNPENLDLNWHAIAQDMNLLQTCVEILSESGCHHWRKSDTDSQYYPILFPLADLSKGIFEALGILPKLMTTPFPYGDGEETVPIDIGADFFEEETIEEILSDAGSFESKEDEENADVAAAKKDKAAYDKVMQLMNTNMTGISDYGILAGYDYYPIFRLGKSKATGQWIGLIAVVSNRYVYS